MNFDFKFYARLLIRRAPVMLLLLLVCSGLGIVLAVRLPTTYETTARMLVQPQQISEALVESTVQINALQEVRLLQEQLMTRANLIDIANDHDVFLNMEQMLPGSVVNAMRNATRIDAGGGGRAAQPVLVSVRFSARTPQIAANVVNEYVTRLSAENVRNRTGAASETLSFFEQEEQRLSTELDIRDDQISTFQRENAEALPADQEFRMQRLTLLQERLSAAARERQALVGTRQRTLDVFEATGQIGAGNTNLTSEQQELADLERARSRALTVYSASAPQVVMLDRQIEGLTEVIAAQMANPAATDTDTTTGAEALLGLQLAEIDSQIATLDGLVETAEVEVTELEEAIARTPLNAITLRQMGRDYENIRRQYDSAVERLAQASVGERIEVSSRGQRITLIEPAAVPTSPASPNRPVIAAGGVAIGLALAGGFFLLLEVLNRTVRRPIEIVNKLGITPLATIPYLESRRERFLRQSLRVSAALVVLVGVPIGLWAIDTHYLPLDLLAERLLNRFGLT